MVGESWEKVKKKVVKKIVERLSSEFALTSRLLHRAISSCNLNVLRSDDRFTYMKPLSYPKQSHHVVFPT